MDKEKLNRLRRMAGAPVDYSPEPKKVTSLVEDGIPGISQIFRGGNEKFYLVCDADEKSELGDVLTELDFPALVNILKSAKNTKDWELFPITQKNKALDLARKRLATVTETVGFGMEARRPENTPYPTDEEIDMAVHGADDDLDNDEVYRELEDFDFEPDTNICPECEGGEHPPAFGDCPRCDGAGEVFESKKAAKDYDGDGKVESSEEEYKGSRDKAIKKAKAKEEQEETKAKPDFADIDKDGDKEETAKKAAKEAKEKETVKEDHFPDGTCLIDPSGKCWEVTGNVGEGDDEVYHLKCPKTGETAKKKYTTIKDWKKGKKEDLKENYHTDDTYPHSFTADEKSPVNIDSSYENVFDYDPDQAPEDYHPTNDTTPVRVPSRIMSELKRVIGEVTAEAEKAKPRDFERAHYYEATAEAMQIVHDLLAEKTVQGLKKAQLYVHRMANVSRALLPDVVWKFLVDGGEKRSLKSYYNEVKDPVLGKPFGVVDVKTLNKNTNTE